jgi:hypothetical protein
MKHRTSFLLIALLATLSCSEPEKVVGSSTEDGQFRLALETEKNWVRPRGNLPVLVRLERLGGPPAEDFEGEIVLVANGGTLSPSRFSIDLDAPDSTGGGGEHSFASWTVFTAASGSTVQERAEINAYFGDALATLKIRVVPVAPTASSQ